jgi:hypothetical protein
MLLLSRRRFLLVGSIVLVTGRANKQAYASADPSQWQIPEGAPLQQPVLIAQDTGGMGGGDPGGGMGSGGSDAGGMGGSSGTGSSSDGGTSSGMGGSGSDGGMNSGSNTGSGNTRGSRNDRGERYEPPRARKNGKKKKSQNLLCMLQGTC